MQPTAISIADYSYDLPQENIAYYPLAERDASKLLIYRDGVISEDIYRNIGAHLQEHTLLTFNNTKVVEARIVFQKETGGQIEIFCLEPPSEYGGISAAMSQTGKVRWRCLIGGASKWKSGQVLRKTIGLKDGAAAAWGMKEDVMTKTSGADISAGKPVILEARYLEKQEDAFLIELSWSPAELSFAGLLHQAGLIPLPPYIRRAAEVSDSERYQTIYARHDGSVAAPTAGLHFTDSIFQSLDERHIQRAFVTLHVGAGTFLPVKAIQLGEHHMHVEFIEVMRDTIDELQAALKAKRPIVPVGTTSARTIESLYWLGVKAAADPELSPEELVVRQWDAYAGAEEGKGNGSLTVDAALTALLAWMNSRGLSRLVTTTQLLIAPGYEWKIASGLITNFHQPESTLLLLIASLMGPDWKRMYVYALEHGFRFLSYGDGCLLWKSGIK
jgi:S-adenosylmethionine:tRNA ribosyltransferase-isomerase